MTGAERIAAERRRQIEEKGYDAGHDAGHAEGDLTSAAMAYLCAATNREAEGRAFWPWMDGFKPSTVVRDLEKAGALLAAEIDRLTAGDGAT